MIGFCESTQYILYVSASVVAFGELIRSITGIPSYLAPLCWLMFYVVALLSIIPGGAVFWQFTATYRPSSLCCSSWSIALVVCLKRT